MAYRIFSSFLKKYKNQVVKSVQMDGGRWGRGQSPNVIGSLCFTRGSWSELQQSPSEVVPLAAVKALHPGVQESKISQGTPFPCQPVIFAKS